MARILIIDDDESVRFSIRHALKSIGHEVAEAENGNQGIALQQDQSFDLVITDIIMPETNGFETIRELKRKHPSLPVIAISGGGRFKSSDYLDVAKMFGVEIVLAKPFTAPELFKSIETTFLNILQLLNIPTF